MIPPISPNLFAALFGSPGRGGGAPFEDNLLGWYRPVSDTDFLESIADNDGLFLPRVAEFNDIDDFLTLNSSIVIDRTKNTVISFGCKLTRATGVRTIMAGVSNTTSNIIFNAGNLVLESDTDGDAVLGVLINNDTDYHEYEITVNNSALSMKQDGVTLSVSGSPISDDITFTKIGKFATFLMTGLIYYVSIVEDGVTIFDMALKGMGDFEYDLSTNENHGTWSGTGGRFDYDAEGSTYAARHGYSLWEHATSDPIQVDFDLTGSPISLTEGVNIPSDYEHKRDIQPSVDKWNMADALVGFNEAGSGDAVFEIFDRFNATRQTVASRASIYYDSTSLATRCRYHVTEAADYAVMQTFFESDYQDKASFGKVVYDGSDIILYEEHLSYATKKTGAPLAEVKTYCNIP